MSDQSSYQLGDAHVSVDAELARLRSQALTGWAKEARALMWFGLRDGMNVLEVGSGPGFVTAQLLEMLPNSCITCLDNDANLLQWAQQYLADKGGERVRFVPASVMQTGLPDDSYDFSIARFLFQHLPDTVGAAREIYRTLKPAGKLAIIDVDDAIWGISDPAIRELDYLLTKFGQAQAIRGGNRHVGRRLASILHEVGFANFDIEAVATNSDTDGMESFNAQFDVQRLQPGVQAGVFSQAQVDSFAVAYQQFLAAPHPFLLMLTLVACTEKPSES